MLGSLASLYQSEQQWSNPYDPIPYDPNPPPFYPQQEQPTHQTPPGQTLEDTLNEFLKGTKQFAELQQQNSPLEECFEEFEQWTF